MTSMQALMDELASDRTVSAEEALRIRQRVFPDGLVSREEAAALLALDARVEGGDPAWTQAFVEAIADCVLAKSPYVDDETARWVVLQFDGVARPLPVHALVRVVERADGAPASLYAFVRERLTALVSGRAVCAEDVELLRRCLYAGDNAVTEEEARWLFAIDAATDGRANAPSWSDFFVKAQLCHLMGRQAPASAEASRKAWLTPPERFEPLSNLGNIFNGGFAGYWRRVRELGQVDQLETYYEAANANAEEDAQLTAAERAFTHSIVKQDGKLTANEQKLLAELQKLQSAA
jgi:hypothetical protein